MHLFWYYKKFYWLRRFTKFFRVIGLIEIVIVRITFSKWFIHLVDFRYFWWILIVVLINMILAAGYFIIMPVISYLSFVNDTYSYARGEYSKKLRKSLPYIYDKLSQGTMPANELNSLLKLIANGMLFPFESSKILENGLVTYAEAHSMDPIDVFYHKDEMGGLLSISLSHKKFEYPFEIAIG